jgi:uncharacterized membrane protein YvlD (DUF360 family)
VSAPTLPSRQPGGIPLRRHLIEFLITAVSFWFLAWILPGFTLADFGTALVAALLLGVLNAVLWPIISRFFSRIILWTAGLLGIVANGLILYLVSEILDGFTIDSLWQAVLASFLMTVVGIALSTWLSVDDDAVWQRQTVRRMVNRLEPPEPTDVPGILFLQIDGLAEPVVRQAMANGQAPTLARWLRDGSHRISGWECDLSSQTGASQAGILHGNNHNMPAFRWYDKEAGKVFTSNRPKDAAEIEARQSDGHGLLADGGVSRSNVFSGDSVDSAITFSTLLDKTKHSHYAANYFLSDPYAISRLIALTLADTWREIVDRRKTRHQGVEPRLKRGGIYPLLRAATTTALRDLTIYTLMSDVYRGVPSAYADFVGYDEVAHHSGIFAPTALDTLRRLDRQLARLEYAIAEAPRPYHVVVLSDHGQTQGSTFLQRYDMSLEDLVDSLIEADIDIAVPEMSSEGWGNLNGALTEAVRDKDSRVGKMLAAATRKRMVDGDVVLGPAHHDELAASTGTDETAKADVIVLASGNLGLVSFTDIEGRATAEQLGARFPGLIPGLAEHPGIGFVLVRSEELGGLVIGGGGIHYLVDDRVEGEDPLAGFGPNAAHHLRRTDTFTNAPDILVNSFYDPHADEGAAFEELIGFHGGMGGNQTHPFLLFPAGFELPDEPIVGAATVHHLFKGWMATINNGTAAAPWTVPEKPAAAPIPGAPSGV